MLTVSGLTVHRGGKPLFSPVSFQLKPSDGLWLRGVNGVGKTSLLSAIAGLHPLSSGQVSWNEQDVKQSRLSLNALMHYVGHELLMHPHLSVLDNIQLDLRCAQPSKQEIIHAMARWALDLDLSQPVGQLSAGQKQRLALVRLSLSHATLWLLDEPLLALDVDSQALVLKACQTHLDEGGLLIITSHQSLGELGSHVSSHHLETSHD